MVRVLSLAVICTIMLTGTAQACRGTVEFKQVAAEFANLDSELESVKELLARFHAALEAHKEAHSKGNMREMLKALKLLRDLREEIPK